MGPDGRAHPFIEKRRVTRKSVSLEGQGGGDFIDEVALALCFPGNEEWSVMYSGEMALQRIFIAAQSHFVFYSEKTHLFVHRIHYATFCVTRTREHDKILEVFVKAVSFCVECLFV